MTEDPGTLNLSIDERQVVLSSMPSVDRLVLEIALRKEADQKLRAAAEASFDAVMMMTPRRDKAGKVVDFIFDFANSKAELYLGRSQAEIVGHGLVELSHTPTTLFVRDGLVRLLQSGEPFRPEMVSELEGILGKWVHYQAQAVGGTVIATVRDIDELKKLQFAMEEREARLNAAERLGRVGSYQFDLGTGLSVWSPGLHDMLEVPNDGPAVSFDRFSELIHPEDLAAWTARCLECGRTGEALDEHVRIKTRSGKVLHMHNLGEVILDVDGKLLKSMGALRDVTQERLYREQLDDQVRMLHGAQVELEIRQQELKRANEKLAEVARTDALTGLNNQRSFMERLQADVNVSSRHGLALTLILMDIDLFKGFNDAYGHPAGDDILLQFGAILHSATRRSDFVARYGGEEFAVVLPSTDLAGGLVLAEKIRAAVESTSFLHGRMTASFGCAQLSPTCKDASTLLSEADRAMYLAKAEGRNRVRSLSSSTSHAVIQMSSAPSTAFTRSGSSGPFCY